MTGIKETSLNAPDRLSLYYTLMFEGSSPEDRAHFESEFKDKANEWYGKFRPEKVTQTWGTSTKAVEGLNAMQDLMSKL